MRINAFAQDVLEGLLPGQIENLIRNMDDTLSGRSKRKTVPTTDWRTYHDNDGSFYAEANHQIGFNAKEIRANATERGQEWTDIGDDWKSYLLEQKRQAEARFAPRRECKVAMDRMAEMILSTYSENDRNDIICALKARYDLRVFYHELRLKQSGGCVIAKGAPSPTSWWEENVLSIAHLPEVLVAQLVGTTPPLSAIVEADWAAGAHIESIRRSQSADGGVVIRVA